MNEYDDDVANRQNKEGHVRRIMFFTILINNDYKSVINTSS